MVGFLKITEFFFGYNSESGTSYAQVNRNNKVLVLAGTEHNQRAGFKRFHAMLLCELRKGFIFGPRIENNTFRMQPE